jgi:hypothetical protein
MRPSNFTNPSQIAITGNWQAWNTITNTWEGETSSTNWHLTINGAFEATKRVITDQGTGTRVLDIASGGGQMLGSLRFEVDDTSDEFTAGNIIATGTVLGTDGTGDAIGLVIGNYYSIESIAGPYKRRADFLDSYGVSIYDGTQQIDCGYDVQEASYLLGGGLHYDIITPLRYARAFFNATSNIFNVRAWDTSWGDNSGSIGYIVRNAYFEQMHRWYIRGVSLFNVCGKA